MIGVVLMAHDHLRRTGQVARHLAEGGCRVAIHVDRRTGEEELGRLLSALGYCPNVVLSPRRACEWGAFSLVEACLDALRVLFDRWPEITHVCQLSGACLPIKPVAMLEAHLDAHRGVDFIDSVPVERDPWVVDGLSLERFTLYHPLPWRRYRWLFDRNVDLQRRLGVARRMPDGLVPHIGSQWWCLSRETLDAILGDPRLPDHVRFFRRSWIPDESFFQTLAAKHSDRGTGQPLTFVRFDAQGKPFVFYDDHRDLLLHAEEFFARKIWSGAHGLYGTFLGDDLAAQLPERREGGGPLLRRFEQATRRHRQGRRGLVSQGRHPGRRIARDGVQLPTARPYLVIDGAERVCPDLAARLAAQPGVDAHGRLFAPDRVELAGGAAVFDGNLTDIVAIRDHKPEHFLSKLVWIARDRRQCFLHDFGDGSRISRFIARDPNARILRVADAWLLTLHAMDCPPGPPLAAAARELADGAARADALQSGEDCRARVVTLRLEDILHGFAETRADLADHLPEGLAVETLLLDARLPASFGPFLERLAQSGAAPEPLDRLAASVRAYESMARKLRRKT